MKEWKNERIGYYKYGSIMDSNIESKMDQQSTMDQQWINDAATMDQRWIDDNKYLC